MRNTSAVLDVIYGGERKEGGLLGPTRYADDDPHIAAASGKTRK